MIILMAVLSVVALVLLLLPILVYDKTESALAGIGTLFFVVILIATPFQFLMSKQTTYELTVADWECSSTYEVRKFTGKTWHTVTECAEYSRKGVKP
jgi:predicted membrane protein